MRHFFTEVTMRHFFTGFTKQAGVYLGIHTYKKDPEEVLGVLSQENPHAHDQDVDAYNSWVDSDERQKKKLGHKFHETQDKFNARVYGSELPYSKWTFDRYYGPKPSGKVLNKAEASELLTKVRKVRNSKRVKDEHYTENGRWVPDKSLLGRLVGRKSKYVRDKTFSDDLKRNADKAMTAFESTLEKAINDKRVKTIGLEWS